MKEVFERIANTWFYYTVEKRVTLSLLLFFFFGALIYLNVIGISWFLIIGIAMTILSMYFPTQQIGIGLFYVGIICISISSQVFWIILLIMIIYIIYSILAKHRINRLQKYALTPPEQMVKIRREKPRIIIKVKRE
jgi:hypothetical protein